MKKNKIKQKRGDLGKSKIFLLDEIFQELYINDNGFDLSRFRVQHKDKIREIDELEWSGILSKNNSEKRYYISAFALPAVDPKLTKEFFVILEEIFVCLQSHYEEKQADPIVLQNIMNVTGILDASELNVFIRILEDSGVFSQWPSLDNIDSCSEFTVDERVINADSYIDFLLRFESIPKFWYGTFSKLRSFILAFVTNKYVYPLLLIFVAEIVRFYFEKTK